MRLLVGWFNIDTGELVDIPGFDNVPELETARWIAASVEIDDRALRDVIRAQRDHEKRNT